jgi:hypothetical protein
VVQITGAVRSPVLPVALPADFATGLHRLTNASLVAVVGYFAFR